MKPEAVIEAAYNDSAGVTEAFIRNVCNEVNRILGSDLDANDFDYRARFSQRRSRVELELVARQPIRIECASPPGLIHWPAGTALLVEVSRKFDPLRLIQQLALFDFELREHLSDESGGFSVLLMARQGGPAAS